MASRYTRVKKTACVFWSQLLAGSIVLFPLSLSQLDFRAVFSHGVSVAAYKASPAYAAFEDLKEDYPDQLVLPERSGELIAAGQQSFKIQEVSNFPRQRHIILAGMTLHAPPQVPAALPTEQPVFLARTSLHQSTRVAALPAPASSYHVDPQDDIWAIAMPEIQGKTDSRYASAQRTLQSSTGTPILIARGDTPFAEPSPIAQDNEYDPTTDDQAFVTNLNPIGFDPENARPLWLNGQIEMTGGLAFVGPETQLVVKRMLNGAAQENGRIWVTEGKFEIHVKKAVGYLVAELHTRDGRILGRGELNLLHLRDVAKNNNRINDLRIALRPTTDTASIRAVPDYTPSSSPGAIREARVEIEAHSDPQAVNDDGFMIDSSLNRDSTFVARATAPKNWASIAIGQAGQPQDIRVFSNGLMDSLIKLNLNGTDRLEALQMGIVWGQISRANKPVMGAKVEMAGDYKPIYFNEAYLPDAKLTATGKNGLFAFLRVRQGVQAVRVKIDGHLYPSQIFPTEPKHVSYLELELRDKVVSQFRVLDVLDMDKVIPARIRLLGSDAVLNVSGDQYVEYSVAGSSFMVEAEAGPEYEISRTTLVGSPQLVNVPVVKREWLRNMALEREVTSQAAHGVVIGFIDDQDFEVEMTGAGPQDQMKIVYFDAQGKALAGRTGVAGGGFAIFNAPAGLQTVFVHPVQSRASYSQVVVAEPEYVNVLAWSAGK